MFLASSAGLTFLAVGLLAQPAAQPAQVPAPPQQPSEIQLTISGEAGAAPRFAVPDFIALPSGDGRPADAETAEAARTIGRVLWDDLNFEREFALIPRDTYDSIPAATSMADVPFDRWRELNADGVVVGHRAEDRRRHPRRGAPVQRAHAAVGLRPRVPGGIANTRLYAHTIADEIHQQQRGLRGVARTKLTFNSDRRRRADGRHGREPQRQGNLHLGLRRREPAAGHHATVR